MRLSAGSHALDLKKFVNASSAMIIFAATNLCTPCSAGIFGVFAILVHHFVPMLAVLRLD